MTKELLAVKGGLLIDATGGEAIKGAIVVVEDGRVAAIQRGGTPPSGARLIDVPDCTIMPGMMDIHLHVAAPNSEDYENSELGHVIRTPPETLLDAVNNCRRLLEAGFTTVRDLDWPAGRSFVPELAALRDAITAGKLSGPRLVVGGMVHTTGSHFDRVMPRNFTRDADYPADGPWEMRRQVRLHLRNGADLIKTCISGGGATFDFRENLMDRNIHIDELKAVVDEAHAYRRLVSAHAHTPDAVRMALEAGVDTLEHCVLTDDDAIARIAESGIYVVPTLAFREQSIIERKRARGAPDFVIKKMLEMRDVCNDTFQRYLKSGVKFAMGTDTQVDPHFGENAREMEVYVNLGMTALQAIQTATRNAAEAMGLLDELGTVEEGKRADLLVISGNPLEDISVLRERDRIKMVIQDGKIAVDRLIQVREMNVAS